MTPTLLLALALAAPVPKAAAGDVTWKFATGDTFYVRYDAETETAVTGAGGGGANANVMTTKAVYKFAVASADATGTVLEAEYVSYRSGLGMNGQPPKEEAVPGVAGRKLTVTLDPAGRVAKLTGADEVAKAAAGTVAAHMLGDDYTRYTLAELFQAVPARPKAGDWAGGFESAFAEGMRMTKQSRVTADGVKAGVATLSVESDYRMGPDAKAKNPAGVELNMSGEKNPATVWFDTKKGRLVKIEETHQMTGGLNLGGGAGAAGQTVTITTKGKSTTVVSDDKPAE